MNAPRTQTDPDARFRVLLVGMRQAIIMILGHLEDYLGMERSIVPRHKRRQEGGDHESTGAA